MRVAGIVLAAGASSRMGRDKMLIEIEGEPLVHRAARIAIEAGLDPVVVVASRDAVRRAVRDLPVRLVDGDPETPNHRSFHAGLTDVDADAAIVLLADMPRIDAAMLTAIASAEGRIVSSRYGGVMAPPLRVDRDLFSELAVGSGKLLAERHGATYVDWPPERLLDWDVPGDLETTGGTEPAGQVASRRRILKGEKDMSSPFPPPSDKFSLPFYYDSLSSFYTYFKVPIGPLEEALRGTGLKPFPFEDPDHGMVDFDFQNYTDQGGNFVGGTNEVEFAIICYPEVREKDVPFGMSIKDFIAGEDQTRTLGYYRYWVGADNAMAVTAGIELFGERKILTTFDYATPSLNLPTQKAWNWTCNDPNDTSLSIVSVQADFSDLVGWSAYLSAIMQYSQLPGGPDRPPAEGGRPIGSRWDIFGLFETHYPLNDAQTAKIVVTPGDSSHPMCQAIKTILGDPAVPAVAVQTYQSPPVAGEGQAFYVDIG